VILEYPPHLLDNYQADGHCRMCCQTPGWVFVGWSACATEQYAPCPFCVLGWVREHYDGSPYRPDGYWQGKATSGLEEACRCKEARLPTKQNRELLAGLMGRFAFVRPTDLPERIGTDIPDFVVNE